MSDSAAYWVAALLDYRFYTPSQAALEDLTSGDLRLIRSGRLRRGILGYIQERDRLQVVEEVEREFVLEQVEPFLRANVDLAAMLPRASLDFDPDLAPVDSRSVAALLSNAAFRSLAYLRWQRSELSNRFGAGVENRLERLVRMIDEELGTGPAGS